MTGLAMGLAPDVVAILLVVALLAGAVDAIAGGGGLPSEIARLAREAGREVFVVAIRGAGEGDWLAGYAHERLGAMNSLRILGRAPGKGAILSFEMRGAHAHDIATVIDRAGVAVRAGTHCAQPLLARYGVTSSCRASFGLYNTLEEVDVLAAALRRAETLFS